jgi:probable HAF family extracellular repeat protein
MWRNKLFSMMSICSMLLLATASGGERSFTFTSVDFPAAVATTAFGINAGGEVVGSYRDVTGKTHGFLLSGGNFSSIDFPGAVATDARGINPQGDIVGTYVNTLGLPGGGLHGYLLRQGVFTTVDFPGHLNTILQRITPSGKILGCYHDTDTMGTMFGFVVSGADFSAIGVPASMHNGESQNGRTIAGLYTDMMTGRTRGYLLEDGNFNPFDVPGSTFTAAWDINPGSETVGIYRDSTGKFLGFLLSNGSFASINFPAATATRAFGINPGGDIVGSYVDSNGNTHGFLLSRTQGHER